MGQYFVDDIAILNELMLIIHYDFFEIGKFVDMFKYLGDSLDVGWVDDIPS